MPCAIAAQGFFLIDSFSFLCYTISSQEDRKKWGKEIWLSPTRFAMMRIILILTMVGECLGESCR